MMSIGCNYDSDCKGPDQICDPYHHCRTNCTDNRIVCHLDEDCDDDNEICRPNCRENKDCRGMGEVCDISRGLCEPGNIYLNYMNYAEVVMIYRL